jgi:hypothetical protein
VRTPITQASTRVAPPPLRRPSVARYEGNTLSYVQSVYSAVSRTRPPVYLAPYHDAIPFVYPLASPLRPPLPTSTLSEPHLLHNSHPSQARARAPPPGPSSRSRGSPRLIAPSNQTSPSLSFRRPLQ